MPPNTDFLALVAPSSGPRRSEKGIKAKAKAKAMQRGEYKLTEALPEGVSLTWEEIKDRLVWEILEIYYFRPAGGSIDPEMAFALTRYTMEEDLHRSVSDFFYRDCNHRPTYFLPRQ